MSFKKIWISLISFWKNYFIDYLFDEFNPIKHGGGVQSARSILKCL